MSPRLQEQPPQDVPSQRDLTLKEYSKIFADFQNAVVMRAFEKHHPEIKRDASISQKEENREVLKWIRNNSIEFRHYFDTTIVPRLKKSEGVYSEGMIDAAWKEFKVFLRTHRPSSTIH